MISKFRNCYKRVINLVDNLFIYCGYIGDKVPLPLPSALVGIHSLVLAERVMPRSLKNIINPILTKSEYFAIVYDAYF